MKQLRNIADYVSEKVKVANADKRYYISTDNMLPNKEGITETVSFPESGSATQYRKDDVLVSNIRPYFKKIWYAANDGSCSNDVLVFRPKDSNQTDSKFLYYLLAQDIFFEHMMAGANGTKMPRGNKKLIPNFEIPDYDLPTQKRIASILSAYDDLIEVNRKQIKLLEEAAERLYREWFIELRFPGHEQLTFNADGLPEGWRKVPLDYVLEKITTGLNPRKNFVLGNGNNYYVTIKNMGNNNVYLDDRCDKVDDAALEKINKRSDLKTGDILFSGIGTIGRVYLISIPTNNWNVSESVFTMRANSNVTKEYLYMLLLSDDMQSYCEQNSHGAAQRGIRMADLKAYKMILPSDDVLRGFTNAVSPLILKVQNLQHQIKQAAEARDLLLPKLMNGEIQL